MNTNYSLDSKLKDAQNYLTKVREILNTRISNPINITEADMQILKLALKENYFHTSLITVIEIIYRGDQKLPKSYLLNLSSNILKITLTDDLEISGMIHGLIINFQQSFNSIRSYFNDFVEFFQKTSNNTIETVNQIFFINTVLKIIHQILYSDRGASSQEGNLRDARDARQLGSYTKSGPSEINPLVINNAHTFLIEGEIHFHLMNLIFFWLTTLKENKTNKCDNILFILIRTVKNTDFLIILKVIYLAALKFVIEKKNISNADSNPNDEIYEHINMTVPDCFKIDTIINENKKHKKLGYLNIILKEETKIPYNFDALNLDYFEELLFNLIKKTEKKIVNYGSFSEVEYLERRNNLLFFENRRIKEVGNNSNILQEYIKYFQAYYHMFKIKFYNCDLIEDLSKVKAYYEEFKSSLNESNLMRFIYLLFTMGKTIEAAIVLQYVKRLDYDLAYKLLKQNLEFHNVDMLEYIWKTSYFELLANLYHQKDKTVHLSVVSNLLQRISNHQYFRKHLLRKLFKIINFFKFLDNL